MSGLSKVSAGVALALCVALAQAQEHTPKYYPLQELITTGKTVVGEDIRYPTTGPARITVAIVSVPPGAPAHHHRHPAPLVAYVLEGELTVEYGEKGTRTYRPGEAFVEAMHLPHRGLNLGKDVVRLLAVYVGAEGTENVTLEK